MVGWLVGLVRNMANLNFNGAELVNKLLMLDQSPLKVCVGGIVPEDLFSKC